MTKELIQHGNGLVLNVTERFRATLTASVVDRTHSGPRGPFLLPELGCHSEGMTPFHAHRSGSDGEPTLFLRCRTLVGLKGGVAGS